MVVHVRNPSTQEDEAGEWRDPGQPGLQSETLPKKAQNTQTKHLGEFLNVKEWAWLERNLGKGTWKT
jgi:hypothetical protein